MNTVHIQVVTYKSNRFFRFLIPSLSSLSKRSPIEVHFLENHSDDSLQSIKKHKPEFKFTYSHSQTNLGFGQGHNYLFNKFKSDYKESFLVLNPDTAISPYALNNITDFIEKLPDKWGIIELEQTPLEHPKDYGDTFETEWASGTAMHFNTQAFKKVGGFDKNIFMYGEDVDISWRIRELGYKIYFCPFAKVAHLTQQQDEEKVGNSFETNQTLGGNLILRYKFFSDAAVESYKKDIQNNHSLESYIEALAIYKKYKSLVPPEAIASFRNYKSPNIYSDTNYAKHRWY